MTGSLVHFEIRAGDGPRAERFWGSLLGWTFTGSLASVPYVTTDAGGGPAGGMYRTEKDERGIVVYFSVLDLDAALERVVELGGTVKDQGPVPEIGWYGHCVDTEGNPFGLFESDPSAPAPAA
jgi:predicted enzyme related to lactoylglutathione lyase